MATCAKCFQPPLLRLQGGTAPHLQSIGDEKTLETHFLLKEIVEQILSKGGWARILSPTNMGRHDGGRPGFDSRSKGFQVKRIRGNPGQQQMAVLDTFSMPGKVFENRKLPSCEETPHGRQNGLPDFLNLSTERTRTDDRIHKALVNVRKGSDQGIDSR
jgi:hypothetical protein